MTKFINSTIHAKTSSVIVLAVIGILILGGAIYVINLTKFMSKGPRFTVYDGYHFCQLINETRNGVNKAVDALKEDHNGTLDHDHKTFSSLKTFPQLDCNYLMDRAISHEEFMKSYRELLLTIGEKIQ